MNVQKITPCLWFDGNGKEAARYYISIFKNSKIISAHPVMTVLELDGLKLMILNGGPRYKLDEAFSLSVPCDTQEEIDYYWNELTADGGEESRCGWCKDKYGVSWQVVPSMIGQLMSDPAKAPKVMSLILEMNKLDIAKLQGA